MNFDAYLLRLHTYQCAYWCATMRTGDMLCIPPMLDARSAIRMPTIRLYRHLVLGANGTSTVFFLERLQANR